MRLPLPLLLTAGLISAVAAQVPPKDDRSFRLAIIGCHRQDRPAPALVRYLEAEPDLALWIGDNVYADTMDDPDFLRECYAALERKPAFRDLRERVPFLATWDDHDYGYNNLGRHYPLKAQSKEIFRRFWKLEDSIPADRDGIYHARRLEVHGRTVQIILLDPRYNRDDPSEVGDTLGEKQWSWLEARLREDADLRLIVSGFQILLDRESGSETWAKFPRARRRLFDTIRHHGAEGVVFLTGDQHYGEVCRLKGALGYDAVELQFCGINQREDPEFNRSRVSPVADALHSYAFLDLRLKSSESDVPHLEFRILDAMRNTPEVIYRLRLDELSLPVRIVGPRTFVESTRVSLQHEQPDLHLRYTIDGSEPGPGSPRYRSPLKLEASAILRARLFDAEGRVRGRRHEARFERVTPRPGQEAPEYRGGLRFRYYEGPFQRLPAFRSLSPVAEGVAHDFDVEALAGRADHHAIRYEGWLRIDSPGVYAFRTRSDDGSRLQISGEVVVDNDGSHGARSREGAIALGMGWHPLRLDYFEDYMGQSLEVSWRREGGTWTALPFSRLGHSPDR